MNDAFNDPDSARSESFVFGEWIDRIAESNGLTRDEILEQLVSSYWLLNEMSEMIEQSGESGDVFSQELGASVAWPNQAEFDSLEEDLTDRLEELDDRIDALEADVEAGPTTEALKERMDLEFDHLRSILEYMLESIDEARADIDSIDHRFDREMIVLYEQRKRLTQLKQLATRLGVSTAECGYCRLPVDLSMLTLPECPQCERGFTNIEPRRTFFGFGFGSNVLKTDGGSETREQPRPQFDGERRSERDEQAEDEPSPIEWEYPERE